MKHWPQSVNDEDEPSAHPLSKSQTPNAQHVAENDKFNAKQWNCESKLIIQIG